MKRIRLQLFLVLVLVGPMVLACGSPSDGAKDVLPPLTAAQKAKREKREGG